LRSFGCHQVPPASFGFEFQELRAAWHDPRERAKTFHFAHRRVKNPDLVKCFREISTEPMPADKATPEAPQRTLTSEIDRWAPII
jgi:hypothetical protein